MAFDLSQIENKTKKSLSPNSSTKESIWEKELYSFSSVFSKKQKEIFYTELSILLESGVHLKESLELIFQGIKKKKEKAVVQSVIDLLVLGKDLGTAFKEQTVFTPYETQSIVIGEETGQLPAVINGLADFFKRYNSQKKELIGALTYPLIVMSTAVLVVIFMLKFVVPIFEDLFKRNQIELPWVTRVVLNISAFMENYFWYIAATLFLVLLSYKQLKKNERWKKFSGNLILKIPYINTLVLQTHLSRFINAMSLLSKAKVNITISLELCKEMISFHPLNMALIQIKDDLIKGDSQSIAFKKHPKLFNNKLIAMIQVAEQTNQDELVYEKLKVRYDDILQQQTKTFTSIINPIMTLLVGLIVGFILVALYLPMFRLSTVIG
jgi:type II secretory pathway component PulF